LAHTNIQVYIIAVLQIMWVKWHSNLIKI